MSDFRMETFVLGDVSTNCYLIYNQKSREAVVVDPADNGAFVLNKCRELQVKPVAVILTHGHFDHILAVEDICRAFSCQVYAGREEDRLLQDSSMNLSTIMGTERTIVCADVLERIGNPWTYGWFGLLLYSVGADSFQRRYFVCRFSGKNRFAYWRPERNCFFHPGETSPIAGRDKGLSGTWGGNHHWAGAKI